MIRRYLLLSITFFVPLQFLPLIINGIAFKQNFLYLAATAFLFGLAVFLTLPVRTFLTLKDNIFTRILINIILVCGLFYVLSNYANIIFVTSGGININFLTSLGFKDIGSAILNQQEVTLVSSLFLSIWGIIMDILVQ